MNIQRFFRICIYKNKNTVYNYDKRLFGEMKCKK